MIDSKTKPKDMAFDVTKIREDFPILHQSINGKPLIYFDNAATTQKPYAVIDALSAYYSSTNANIHRGIHFLAEQATAAFESTRNLVKEFIHAQQREEIIFTKGTTEGINLIASTYGRKFLKEGDEILISALEHHSNIVPWQILAQEKNIQLKIIPINDAGELLVDEYKKLLSEKTKVVSLVHVSNALGTINPIKEMVSLAHQYGAIVVVDGAQSTSHLDIDVQDLDVDFFVFSGHKIYGPTGIGVLYGKRELLEAMPPYQGGGEMIGEVTYAGFTVNELPYKFEAGTPNIADVVALKYALQFIQKISKQVIRNHENELVALATDALHKIDGVKLIGTAKQKVSVVSFIIDGVHHQDLGVLLDQHGIAIRTGHHCTQPLMNRLGITGTSRASFAVYNTKEEVNTFVEALSKALKMLR